jgi:hypothetical protein
MGTKGSVQGSVQGFRNWPAASGSFGGIKDTGYCI